MHSRELQGSGPRLGAPRSQDVLLGRLDIMSEEVAELLKSPPKHFSISTRGLAVCQQTELGHLLPFLCQSSAR